MKPKTIFLLILVALIAVVLLQNMTTVPIRLLFWSVSAPLLIFLLGAVFVGWLVGWFSHLAYFKGKYEARSEKRSDN
jgi:uncharacterized integral membrane protein